MLADYFTKPLQGALFREFRDIIMVKLIPFTLLGDKYSYTSKERVGKIPPKNIPLGPGEPLNHKYA